MASRMAGVLRVLFVAYVVATAVHIGLVMAHEPFAFDAWNVAQDTGAAPFSVTSFVEYGVGQYTGSNPRLGQWFTYLAYKLELFAEIATPLAYLGLALAVTVLGLGRWPSWRRGRDLALYALALGFLWFAIPQLGMIMFCRAYSANYLYGAAIQLWFLVPLRLRPSGEGTWREAFAYGVLGIAAGMCNEHTGPTLLLFAAGYALWRQRQGPRPALAWAGALGVAIGFAAIFFAPGQGQRYDGLATQVSLLGRLLRRGFEGNLDILAGFVAGVAPVLVLLALVLVLGARDRLRDVDLDARTAAMLRVGGALAAGVLITVTVFVSPKLGARFYLHSCALVLAAFLGVADVVLTRARRLAPFVLIALIASTHAAVQTIPLYLRLHVASTERLAALATAPPNSVFTAYGFEQIEASWWFLGDDFRDAKKRDLVTRYFGLRDVVLRAIDLGAPLGVSDVRIVPRYEITPASSLDQLGGFELGAYRSLDVASVREAARRAIGRVRERLGDRGRIDRVDLMIDFIGAPPPLPRERLLLGRWTPERFEGGGGAIERRDAWKTRGVVVPPELRDTDLEIYILRVGGEARRLGTARGENLEYVPWERGSYWALACSSSECFVIAAARVQ